MKQYQNIYIPTPLHRKIKQFLAKRSVKLGGWVALKLREALEKEKAAE